MTFFGPIGKILIRKTKILLTILPKRGVLSEKKKLGIFYIIVTSQSLGEVFGRLI